MAGATIEVMKALHKPTATEQSYVPIRRADDAGSINLDHNNWLLGVTIGVPFFAGAVLGLLMTDPITGIMGFGRRGAICAAGIFSFISVVGSASVHKWDHLLGFRIMLGAGMAGKASIVPILLSETSPKNIRGMLLVFWQLFVAFGLAAGSVANLSVYRLSPPESWRYMFIAACIPALLLLSLILFSPEILTAAESPRWLLKESGADKNRAPGNPRRRALVQDAFKSLLDLRGEPSPILAAGELFLMHTRLIDEQRRLQDALSHAERSGTARKKESVSVDQFRQVVDHIGWWPRVQLMFLRSGFTRRAHIAAATVMISQQLCGINLIVFLADFFFRYSFFPNHDPSPAQNVQLLGASLGLMLLNFLATIPALFIIDRANGRRRALNWSFPCMAISLLSSALILKAPDTETGQPRVGTIVGHYIFLAAFMIAYSIGEGPAAFVVSAEVFPLVNRELGMSLAVFWNFVGAGLLAVVSPWLLKELGQFGVLLLFAGLNMLAWFLCFWLVPSTGNEDLENVYKKLEVTLGFMLSYLAKVALWRATRLAQFCANFGFKEWEECGYGPKPENPVEAFERYRES
ncbi:sugar transporter [Pyrenophora seminiperda CCB06]|uniref:Sugar transporter n=1 Tax=Pyrenophora seminiperda CCB06 TaxID=1302712 RepID=A0A3M7MCD0_9PLEO|nr:sugar transporter [Pyrenophora seminiperda CCB06]